MQIEAGKRYVRRDGKKTGLMTRTSPHAKWPWECSLFGVTYRDDGTQGFFEGERKEADLIEEWTEPTATPAPAGPVRMVRQIVPGVYGRVWVGRFPDGTWKGRPLLVALIEHDNPNPDRPPFLAAMNADELRSAAMVFSQLAEALDDQP